jgi:hypothetical protein
MRIMEQLLPKRRGVPNSCWQQEGRDDNNGTAVTNMKRIISRVQCSCSKQEGRAGNKLDTYVWPMCIRQSCACAYFFLYATATPQLEGRSSTTAYLHLFKEMLIRDCIFAYPQNTTFSAVSNFKSATFMTNVVFNCISAHLQQKFF